MKSKVDGFGRALLPKKARQVSGLTPGTELRVEAVDGEIKLIRTEGRGHLVRKRNGTLVWSGNGPTEPHDIVKFIEDLRNERIRQTWGLDEK